MRVFRASAATLRCYVQALPPGQTGWLAGTRDLAVGKALGFLHRKPAHPWTVADLARRAGLSRTRLAERFQHYLRQSPMAYLAQWRLKLGAEMLQSGNESVAEVAGAVGYGSEAALPGRSSVSSVVLPRNSAVSVTPTRPKLPDRQTLSSPLDRDPGQNHLRPEGVIEDPLRKDVTCPGA